MVDRALAQQARAALNRLAHNTAALTGRTGGFFIRRPKDNTVGTPKADAMCIGPESFVRNTSQAAAISINSPSAVEPARLTHCTLADSIRARTISQMPVSCWDPNTATAAPRSLATCIAASAKRSGNQRFAPP